MANPRSRELQRFQSLDSPCKVKVIVFMTPELKPMGRTGL